MALVAAGGTAFTVPLFEAGVAACGEPAQPSTAVCFGTARWCGNGARGGRGRSEGRKSEARKLKRSTGARDNKSIAEIGKRHLSRAKDSHGFGRGETERGVAGFGDRITLARPVAGSREMGVPAVKRSARTVLNEARLLLAEKSGSNQSKVFWVVNIASLTGVRWERPW